MEECVMDVFMEVIQHYDMAHEGSVKAYIGTVARRKAIDRFRALSYGQGHTTILDHEQFSELPSAHLVDDAVENAECSRILLDQILALGEPDSTIILQKYFYDRNSKEIASITGLSPAAVRMRCTHAMKRLKTELAKREITL